MKIWARDFCLGEIRRTRALTTDSDSGSAAPATVPTGAAFGINPQAIKEDESLKEGDEIKKKQEEALRKRQEEKKRREAEAKKSKSDASYQKWQQAEARYRETGSAGWGAAAAAAKAEYLNSKHDDSTSLKYVPVATSSSAYLKPEDAAAKDLRLVGRRLGTRVPVSTPMPKRSPETQFLTPETLPIIADQEAARAPQSNPWQNVTPIQKLIAVGAVAAIGYSLLTAPKPRKMPSFE